MWALSDKHFSHLGSVRALLAAAFLILAVPPCYAQFGEGGPQANVENRRECNAWMQAAQVALRKGDNEEAIRRYSAVEARNCPGADMEIAINRGMAYHHLGRFEEAMRDYDEAVKFDPRDRHTSAVIHNNRCYALTVLGRADQALADCDKAVSLSPRQNELYLSTRAFAYSRLGRYQEALRDFDAALQSDPKKADALYSRGVIKQHLGMPGGDADIATALALDPSLRRPAQ
jgi:tetratricopeptide (TPR) repeat protein